MTTPASSSLASPTRFLLVLGCFVLSGSAGLMYETAWTQEFALVFGTSDLAVSAVLAAYMAGLMVGARLAESLLPRVRRPLRAYAVLELLIAAAALAVPPAIGLSRHLYVALFSTPQLTEFQGTGAAVFYLLTAFLALLLPTAMMGATLPLLVRYAVGRDAEIGRRVGLLYGANTLGAAAGTLITAFVLLPRLGLDRTVWVAIGVNLTVFALAILLARTSGDGSAAAGDADGVAAAPAREGVDGARIVLPIMLVSGAVAFGWEVLWTRLLSHLLGGSVYAFGLMLATFLTGLALGAWIASRLAHSARRAGAAFALAQLGIALSSWIAFALADALPGWLAGRSALELGWASAVAAVTLLPGAVFMGATFPLAVRLLARHPDEAASVSARVYVWNTCGTIFGAVGTGFVLLPTLRFAGTATLLVVVGTLLAALAAWRLSEALGMRRATYALVAAALIAVVVRPPAPPWSLLRTAPLSGQIAQGEVTFYAVGRSSTVLLTEEPPGWRLTNNGLPESMIQPPASLGHPLTVARWLSMLPIVSRPAAESMLIVGLGG
ncbi:MAG: fused MFS/spermidine synthase, partial [Acidobacteriota bacterium]